MPENVQPGWHGRGGCDGAEPWRNSATCRGIDAATFLAHLNQRAGYYHDKSLTGMETTSPGFAASFDTRAADGTFSIRAPPCEGAT